MVRTSRRTVKLLSKSSKAYTAKSNSADPSRIGTVAGAYLSSTAYLLQL